MQDGRTRKLTRSDASPEARDFFKQYSPSVVTLTGTTAGNEHLLEQAAVILGRGGDSDLRFEDPAMSREHAVLELISGGFRIRDLGSTNGLSVNGHPTLVADLKHGDRLQVGEHTFQYLCEARPRAPRTFVVEDD